MNASKFHHALGKCRQVIATHMPGLNARLDFDSRLYAESLRTDLQALIQRLSPGAKVLDLGCGKGHISALLAEAGYRIIGLDVAQTPGEQLEIDTPYWQSPLWRGFQDHWNAHYCYYGGTGIPMSNGSLDAVVSYAVLEHVSDGDRRALLEEIARVLRPEGYLFVAKCPRHWALSEHLAAALGLPHHERLVSGRELRTWLEEAGLKVVTMERTDLIPAFPPAALWAWWNQLAPLLSGLDHLLRITPCALLAHHQRALAQKPAGLDRRR